jgi:hypothetical protein
MVYLRSQWTPNVQIKYFIFDWSIYRLFLLNTGWKLIPNNFIRICVLAMKHSWTKSAFWDVNNKKWHKWAKFVSPSLFKDTYGLPVLAKAPNIKIKYFMFDWSIYTLLVLNTGWKRESLQMKIFVNVCSTWNIFEIKTRLETWINRNVVNCVSFFHLSYLITLMAYLCSQWTPNEQIKYFMFDWSICKLFVLNRGWKCTLQIMIFVCFLDEKRSWT